MNSRRRRNRGFSLIELMVVIAIIAILAAVAVPAYKSYLFNGKVAPYISLMYSLRDQALNYISKHGATPLPGQLGFNPGTGPHIGDNVYGDPAQLGPIGDNLYGFAVYDWGGSTSGCGAKIYVQLDIKPSALGFTSAEVDSFNLELNTLYHNGEYETILTYAYALNGNSIPADLGISGFINDNTTSGWDYNNWTTLVDNVTLTCP